MGTSTYSKGAKGGVSFDPPWLDTLVEEIAGAVGDVSLGPGEIDVVSPKARYSGAHRNLNGFAANGSRESLLRAMRSYVRKGLGGSARATRRLRYPIALGARLLYILKSLRDNQNQDLLSIITELRSQSASISEISAAIVKSIVQSAGSVEEARAEEAMAEALVEFLLYQEDREDLDIANLSDMDIFEILELFFSNVIFAQTWFDIGQMFETLSLSPAERQTKADELRLLIRSFVGTEISKIRRQGVMPSTEHEAARIISSGIKCVYDAFIGGPEND